MLFKGTNADKEYTATEICDSIGERRESRNRVAYGVNDLKRALYDINTRTVVKNLAIGYKFSFPECQSQKSIVKAEGITASKTISFPCNIGRRELALHMCKGRCELPTTNEGQAALTVMITINWRYCWCINWRHTAAARHRSCLRNSYFQFDVFNPCSIVKLLAVFSR